jgi:hypothetical protein
MFETVKYEVAAAVLVASLAGGFGAGWFVNGWRLGVKTAELQGVVDTQKQSLATLEGVNQRCAAGVADVKGAVKVIADEAAARTEAATKAMQAAEKGAAAHLAAATSAMNRPPAPPGTECDRAAAEAEAYAKKRRGAP